MGMFGGAAFAKALRTGIASFAARLLELVAAAKLFGGMVVLRKRGRELIGSEAVGMLAEIPF